MLDGREIIMQILFSLNFITNIIKPLHDKLVKRPFSLEWRPHKCCQNYNRSSKRPFLPLSSYFTSI